MSTKTKEPKHEKANVIGIDFAKNVIQVCIISQDGELLPNKAISPNKLKEQLANNIKPADGIGRSKLASAEMRCYGYPIHR